MTDTKRDKLLTVRVPEELITAIKKAAAKARRTFPDFIRITLEDGSKSTDS